MPAITKTDIPDSSIVSPDDNEARFRDAMSRVAATVHVITTAGPAGLGGITASAVTSVTLEPPMMLFCINKSSSSLQRFLDNGVFCINTLGPHDESLSDVFAGRTNQHLDDRFAAGGWATLATGAPVLASAVAAFDCRLIEAKEISTHFIMIGAVEAVEYTPDEGQSLGYVHRKYKAF